MQDNSQVINGIVVALKANYFIVEIDNDKKISDFNNRGIRFLCTKRNKLSYQGSFVSVGDFVGIDFSPQNCHIFDEKGRVFEKI